MNETVNPEAISALVSMIVALPFIMLIFMFALLGVAIAATIFWIWMLIDCATNDRLAGTDKVVWILIVLFTHLLGALIYYFVQRPKKTIKPHPLIRVPPPLPISVTNQEGDTDRKYYENYGKK